MRLVLADLPAWAQVTIALAVPLNTFIGIVGAIVLRRAGRRSRRDNSRLRRRIVELEEEVGKRRNGVAG